MSSSNQTEMVGGQQGVVGASFNATASIDRWHHQMELAAIVTCNSLALLIMVTRIYIRSFKIKRKFRSDDYWMFAALLFLIMPHFVAQIGANYNGSGLHLINVTDKHMRSYWYFSWGYCGYYIVISIIKISQCCCLLQILPTHLKIFKRCIYGLCTVILALGLTETLVWLFQCRPFLSNFIWHIEQIKCLDLDPFRYTWVALSVPIDAIIIYIPFGIITRTQLRRHEKRVLTMVFAANLLGTIACALGAYGAWSNRLSVSNDFTWAESTFIITNDIEILLYTLGASFPVLSPYFISYYAPSTTRPTTTGAASGGGIGMKSWKKITGIGGGNKGAAGRSKNGTTTIGHKRNRRSRGVKDLDMEMLSTMGGPLEITVDWEVDVRRATKDGNSADQNKSMTIEERSIGETETESAEEEGGSTSKNGHESMGSEAELRGQTADERERVAKGKVRF